MTDIFGDGYWQEYILRSHPSWSMSFTSSVMDIIIPVIDENGNGGETVNGDGDTVYPMGVTPKSIDADKIGVIYFTLVDDTSSIIVKDQDVERNVTVFCKNKP